MNLDTLLDEREIIRKLSRFARILDAKRYDAIGEVFADGIAFDYGVGGAQQGIDALRALFRNFLDSCGPTQHLIGSVTVDIDGDRAVSRAYVQARHQRRDDANGTVIDTNGDYVDRWERLPQGWRIVRRDAEWAMFTGDAGILQLP